MEDYMLYKKLKEKYEPEYRDEDDIVEQFRHYMSNKRDSTPWAFMPSKDNSHWDFYMKRHTKDMDWEDDYRNSSYMRGRYNAKYMKDHLENHFDESSAEHIVSEMYHTEKGKRHSGEKFSMHKAKEVIDRYRGIIPHNITVEDVYVAINAQYHDYAELFRGWFGDNIDQKIIESAIVFWFKDIDSKSENKVLDYFKEY